MIHVAHPLAWLAGFFGLVIATQIAGAVRKARARRATIAAMGFREVPALELFSSASTDGADLFDHFAYDIETFKPGIYAPVAVGPTAIGEAAIFDYSFRTGSRAPVTVIGVRAPREIAPFTIHHVLLGDRISRWLASKAGAQPSSGGGAPRMTAHIVLGAGGVQLAHPTPIKPVVAMDDQPEFAKRWMVKSLDGAGVRRVLTPAAMEALDALDDQTLAIEKGAEWIFFYFDSRTAQPAEYQPLLDGATRLIGLLDLRR